MQPGMSLDQESNRQPFALEDNAQPTEPRRSGLQLICSLIPSGAHLVVKETGECSDGAVDANVAGA